MTIVHTDQPLKRVNDGEAVAPRRRIGNHPAGPIVLGTASWAVHDEPLDAGRATAVLAAALDGGVTVIDTAFVYTTRTETSYAERLVGAALKQIRTDESILVATKGGHHRDKDTFAFDGRPDTIRRQCELSLIALGLERIGLYQLHRPDPEVPIEETMGVFAELRDEGKIELVGLSNVTAEQLEQARAVVDITSVQNRREPGAPDVVLDRCEDLGIAFLTYSPLGGRALAREHGARGAVAAIARTHGVSAEQVVLAWHLSASPNVFAIVGARRVETIRDSARAATLDLSASELLLLGGYLA